MRGSRRSRVSLLAIGITVLCLVGTAAAAAPVGAVGALLPRVGGPALLLYEDFEDELAGINFPHAPWTVWDINLATGGDVRWDDDDFKPHQGSYSVWPANGGADGLDPGPYVDYVPQMDTWITCGPIDLSGYGAALFDFWYWNRSEVGYDFFSWGASSDMLPSFVWMEEVDGDSGGWVHAVADLSAYAGDATVWIGFRFRSDEFSEDVGAFVDDVSIWGLSSAPASFGKTAPADDAATGLGPTLSWAAAGGAASYEYCVDTSDDNACDGSWVSTGFATEAAPTGLTAGTTYFWQVRAVNGIGTTEADGGTWWSFTPATPTPVEGQFRSIGTFDGWALEQDEAAGKGGSFDATAVTGRLGDDEADRQYRAILDFDTSSLPDDAVVTGVTLRIKRQSILGTNPFTTHGYLLVDVKAGFYHDVQALERFDFQAAGSRGNVGRFIKTPSDGWWRAPLRARSFALINLTGTTQFRLRFEMDDNDDQGADYVSFYSGEAVNDANRPELIVTYYVP